MGLRCWPVHGKVSSVKYNPMGSMLVMRDNIGNILMTELTENSEISSYQCVWDFSEDLSPYMKPVMKLEFIKSSRNRASVLTTIDKGIEIWKIYPQPSRNIYSGLASKQEQSLNGVHECIINSISMCPNGKNFISSDDLNVYLWDLNKHDKVCHIVDHKETVKPISEVITSSKFHPDKPYEILWTSTNGTIRIGDLRTKFLMDQPTQTFKYRSKIVDYYDELVYSISYAEFCHNTDCVVARDYFTVKYWDLRNTKEPCLKVDVIENSNKSMRELCDSQEICAEFEVKDSAGSEFCVTGGYGKILIIERADGKIREIRVDGENEILHLDMDSRGNVAFGDDTTLRVFDTNNLRT